MPDRNLHIISFDIPYPPNYGGVIDVFYKLKALHQHGIKIHLHCFEHRRKQAPVLESICRRVYYYQRKTGLLAALSLKPYIVSSRRSERLIQILKQDDYPILFEGLHSCYYIGHPDLKSRLKIYRESNIEHHYYFNLSKAERNPLKKLYFLTASIKLRAYQPVLKHAQLMFAVSKTDTEYLKKRFGDNRVFYLPSFHPNNEFNVLTGFGNYTLYHGNLSVPENHKAAEFLIKKVFCANDHPVIIAGLNPHRSLVNLIGENEHITLVANPGHDQMVELIRNAHVHVLVTFQATGLKLKLLNTLFSGRHILVNSIMLNGTGLEGLCYVAENQWEIRSKLSDLFGTAMTESEIAKRKQILWRDYNNESNARRLIGIIFGDSENSAVFTT